MTPLASLSDEELVAVALRLPVPTLARILRSDRPGLAKVSLTVAECMRRINAAGFAWEFRAIAITHGTTLDEVLAGSQRPRIVVARHAMWRHAKAAGRSYPEIGAMFDRDHSSVIYACMSPEERLARNRVRCDASRLAIAARKAA